jgi:hypothetical protein
MSFWSAIFLWSLLLQIPSTNELPVEITVREFDETSVYFELKNLWDEPLTAWALKITSVYMDGRKESMIVRFDLFKVLDSDISQVPMVHPGKGPLWPGQVHLGREGYAAVPDLQVSPDKIEVEPLALLTETKGLGNRAQVKVMRDFRKGYVRETVRISDLLNDPALRDKSVRPIERLKEIRQRLEVAGPEIPDESPAFRRGTENARVLTLDSLRDVLRAIENTPSNAESQINTFIDRSGAAAAALEKFSRRPTRNE